MGPESVPVPVSTENTNKVTFAPHVDRMALSSTTKVAINFGASNLTAVWSSSLLLDQAKLLYFYVIGASIYWG